MTQTQATTPNIPTNESTLTELLACNGHQFVHCAYRTLLGREPDPEGMTYYLRRLRTGFSKIQILTQLRLSKEGQSREVSLPSLDIAVQRYRRGNYPIVGWLFKLLYGGEGDHPIERKLRVIEYQISLRRDDDNRQSFNQLETLLNGLNHLILQQTQAVVLDLGAHPNHTDASASTISLNLSMQNRFENDSPTVRAIYLELQFAKAKQRNIQL